MFQDITVTELIELRKKTDCTIVDVRSPSEYRDGTIPGSSNIPLFTDEERASVGTLYKQSSVQAAKDRGLEIVSGKLPKYIKTFEDMKEPKVVFCWRGGMRSKTAATVLSLMGMRVYRLTGGVRAHRKWVVKTLENFDVKPQPVVIHGNTGTGKTILLRRLAEESYPVLDLEGLAGHRGSIFGEIGLRAHNQKTFDALLLEELIRLQASPYVMFEAESQRIGKVVMPEFLLQKKAEGIQIVIELPMEERVRYILEEYQPWEHHEACIEAFNRIKQRIHTPVAKEISSYLEAGEFAPAVELLLQHYYDPRYAHSAKGYEDKPWRSIKASSLDDAYDQLKECLKHIPI